MAEQQNNEVTNQVNRQLIPENIENFRESETEINESITYLDITDVIQRAAECREKWNFDFENERPLEGDWIWEKVSGSEKLDGEERIEEHEDESQTENTA